MQYVVKHLQHMLDFALLITPGVVHPKVNHPELVCFMIDANAGHYSDTVDYPLFVAAPLLPY